MAKKNAEMGGPAGNFDEQLEKLRVIVERMEQGDLNLDESLKLFEQGIASARELFDILNRAEGRVEELLESMQRIPFSRMDG